MWINVGSYYDNGDKNGQLDGDEYTQDMIYNLDRVGQSSPIDRFNESEFNNEYKYRLDYLIGNVMTVSDASGSRDVNVFDMMRIPNKILCFTSSTFNRMGVDPSRTIITWASNFLAVNSVFTF